MYYKEFSGINAFLVEMARLLLKDGVKRITRNFNCFELPAPVIIKILNPSSRIITISAREWNYTLPYVESLWLASGRNDIKMVAHYVKKMLEFSDDKETMRAGYGPRFRFFTGVSDDYNNGYLYEPGNINQFNTAEIDQFDFVEKSFQKDPNTRQAIITIGDPAKDCFQEENILKQTKDFPCTRDIQFIRQNDKLDVIVHMRSNDFVWGAGGVNIFNFTFLQEYFAKILGLPVGHYYHIVNNFHYYENLKPMVEGIAATIQYYDEPYIYNKSFSTLADFDERLFAFQKYEYEIREKKSSDLIDFGDDFFNDWAKVLYQFHKQQPGIVSYANPYLNQICSMKKNKTEIKNNRDQLESSVLTDINNNQAYWRQYI